MDLIEEVKTKNNEYNNLRWTYVKYYSEYPHKFIKLYSNESTHFAAGNHTHKWPFIDIFFYETNDTHLWYKSKRRAAVPLEYIFPLNLRPLGNIFINNNSNNNY